MVEWRGEGRHVHPSPRSHDRHVRCRLCGATLPGRLPIPHVPHATLLMDHLDRRHHEAFVPWRQRTATEDFGMVAMAAFQRVENASPQGGTPCA